MTTQIISHDTTANDAGFPPAPSEAHQSAHYSATYDPADNKLRLRSISRLDQETYARVKGPVLFMRQNKAFSWLPCGRLSANDCF